MYAVSSRWRSKMFETTTQKFTPPTIRLTTLKRVRCDSAVREHITTELLVLRRVRRLGGRFVRRCMTFLPPRMAVPRSTLRVAVALSVRQRLEYGVMQLRQRELQQEARRATSCSPTMCPSWSSTL